MLCYYCAIVYNYKYKVRGFDLAEVTKAIGGNAAEPEMFTGGIAPPSSTSARRREVATSVRAGSRWTGACLSSLPREVFHCLV